VGRTDPTAFLGLDLPIAGIAGDQQAALFGQGCYDEGRSKCTYGTGSFVLVNTGTTPVLSERLLTTVAWMAPDGTLTYALEGAVFVTGAAVQWLRDQLGLISTTAEVEQLASTVEDNGGVYFVPAFSGLFAPHWREDARGTIVGLTAYARSGHLARAVLEATAWQTREVLDAARERSGAPLSALRVDGGMTANELLMQFQADVLGVPVIRPEVTETTALGAAFAAGLAVGFWTDLEELGERWHEERRWEPEMEPDRREREYCQWRRAVERSLGWVSPKE
jgi:glycerol kinase